MNGVGERQRYDNYITQYSPCKWNMRKVSVVAGSTAAGAALFGAGGAAFGATTGAPVLGMGAIPSAAVFGAIGVAGGAVIGLGTGIAAVELWDYTEYRAWQKSQQNLDIQVNDYLPAVDFDRHRNRQPANNVARNIAPNNQLDVSPKDLTVIDDSLTVRNVMASDDDISVEPIIKSISKKRAEPLLAKLTELVEGEDAEDYICPLTLCLPLMPVVTPHNNKQVFELEAMRAAIKKFGVCPVTQLPTKPSQLKAAPRSLGVLRDVCERALSGNYDKEKVQFTENELDGIRIVLKECKQKTKRLWLEEEQELTKMVLEDETDLRDLANRMERFTNSVLPRRKIIN